MDIYDTAIKALREDKTPLTHLVDKIRVPFSTLRDIKTRKCKSPGLKTLKKIVAHYGKP